MSPGTPRTINEALRGGAHQLAAEGIEEAFLEAELLLRHALGLDRTHLYLRLHDPLERPQEQRYRRLLSRRLRREPSAYILGHREFWGLDFEVTPVALIPRPETELLVELANELMGATAPLVADVGTGCGALAVALAQELPGATVIATDTSLPALGLARHNSQRHGVGHRVTPVACDLLSAVASPLALIVANLPYVKSSDWEGLPAEIRDYEPRWALDGGPDGLEPLRRLLTSAPAHLAPGGLLLAEIGDDQGAAALRLDRDAFPAARVEVRRDLAGRDRALVVRPEAPPMSPPA